MITTFYPPYSFGGDALFVYSLANALARRGHEIDVIHCADSFKSLAKNSSPFDDYPHEPGVTVHQLNSRAGILSPLATYLTGRPVFKAEKIKKILSAKRFDVIHFHNISLVGGPGILSYGDAVKLYTLHEYWLICPTHVLFKFKQEVCASKECWQCQLTYHRPPQLWRSTGLLKSELRHVDAFIAPSQFILERHREENLDIPLFHLPNFCSHENSAPISLDVPSNIPLPSRPFFLFAGRLEKLKGLQTVIPLFKKYSGADLVIAGDGNYAPELERLAAGCERIHFLKQLSQKELQSVYKRALALVIPSLWYESFPLVIIEAYAAGIPVIARRIGSLTEVVEGSGGGLLFENETGLLAAMERLRTDSSLRNRLIENGARAFRTQWSEEIHLERYLALVEDIRTNKYSVKEVYAASH